MSFFILCYLRLLSEVVNAPPSIKRRRQSLPRPGSPAFDALPAVTMPYVVYVSSGFDALTRLNSELLGAAISDKNNSTSSVPCGDMRCAPFGFFFRASLL